MPENNPTEEKADPSDAEDLKATESLLAYSWKALELAWQHFTRIDTKVASVAGFVGVSATILVAVSRASFPAPETQNILYFISRTAFLMLLGSLFTAFGFCLRALHPQAIRRLPTVPDIVAILFKAEKVQHASRKIQKEVVNHISVIEGSVYAATSEKEKLFKWAIHALWGALGFAIIAAMFYLLDATIRADAYRERTTTEHTTTEPGPASSSPTPGG